MHDGQAMERLALHPEVSDRPLRLGNRVLDSWERSRAYGVPLSEVDPAFTGSIDDQSLFFECGREVLSALHSTLSNEPVALMLTDADGLVLNRVSGDHSLLRALDNVHLAPGFTYSERDVGTNGLGLALADRVPTVVRAEEHYALNLCGYTCAAAPIVDPMTGRLEGSINLTTWSESSHELLLALAQSAAGSTSALMQARSSGHRPRSQPRGEVFRVRPATLLQAGSSACGELSPQWNAAVDAAASGLRDGSTLAVLGEPGSGRATAVAVALHRVRPDDRVLVASAPAPNDVDAWLSLWSPELSKPNTSIIIGDVDALPLTAAHRLRDLVVAARSQQAGALLAVTAERLDTVPGPLAALTGTVVHVPALHERREDVMTLARHLAHVTRGRHVNFTPAAVRALQGHTWSGNVDELAGAVRRAVAHTDIVDVRHLPAHVLSDSTQRLSRIEAFEREEIVRVLTQRHITMAQAADELGLSRATVYRKITQYGIRLPRR